MFSLLCPNLTINTLYEINASKLKENDIKGVIFDLDNTIIPWDSPTIPPEILVWIQGLMDSGFKICLLSNNTVSRVSNIAANFKAPFVSRAYKPSKRGFRRAAELMNLNPVEVAVIGDQLYTDILGGNRLGMFTVWVTPLSSREFIGTKATRQLEKITVRILKAKGLLK